MPNAPVATPAPIPAPPVPDAEAAVQSTGDLGEAGDYDLVVRYPGSDMTEVFLAHKTSKYGFIRRAVVKRANHTSSAYEECRQMLLDEARALAWLDHVNIVQILDVGDDHTGFYLAMEHVDGSDLRRVNRVLRKRGEALPFELACYIAGGVLRGLHHAHSAVDTEGQPLEIVHRDVNPSNVLISVTGHIKLTDFGVVKMRDRLQDKTKPGIVKGKFTYLAPEYIMGRPCDGRVDVYAVGVMLLEMLTGRPAFSGKSAADIMRKIVKSQLPLDRLSREGVPDELERIVRRATEVDPEMRFTSAEDMANTLETWIMRAGYHATPWILSAFFHQHELYSAERRAAAEPERSTGEEKIDVQQVIEEVVAEPPPPEPPPQPEPELEPLAEREVTEPLATTPMPVTIPEPSPAPAEANADAPLGSTEEVAVPPPQPTIAEPIISEPEPGVGPFAGNLDDARPGDVLLDLYTARASGTIEFSNGPIWKKLEIIEGGPARITSNMGMEMFGEQLVRAKLLKRAELDRVMRELGRGGETLVERLISRELIDEAQLAEQLGLNIADRLLEVLSWRAGEFSFDGEPPPRPALMPRLDLETFVEENRPSYEHRRPAVQQSEDPVERVGGIKPSLTDALRMARAVTKGGGKGRIDEV